MKCSRLMVCICALLLSACLPDRQDDAANADADVNASVDSASDAPITSDTEAALAQDVTATNGAKAKGCNTDDQCAALLSALCHQAQCNLSTGLCELSVKADGSPCSSDSKCVSSQQCQSGQCIGEAVDCDDDNICTTDLCVASLGCLNSNNDLPCFDGDPCTGPDACDEGTCIGQALECEDAAEPCWAYSCQPSAGGCVKLPIQSTLGDAVSCDDGDPCTEDDACSKGTCKGSFKQCPDDGDGCTIELCLQGKCLSSPSMGQACDDQDPCTEMDVCSPNPANPLQPLCAGVALQCDDDNPCTDDSCGASGCTNQPNSAACDDGDLCTEQSVCTQGVCVGSATKSCDDGFTCTQDACDSKTKGCVHSPTTQACNDGDACSSDDVCQITSQGGALCAGKPTDCDDANPCTEDSCDSTVGCIQQPSLNFAACTLQAGATGFCWTGQCKASKCGNAVCEPQEATSTCASDCPEGGGVCLSEEATCVTSCRETACAAPDGACAADSECVAIQTCLSGCSDDTCRLKCSQDGAASSLQTYHELRFCLMTQCLKNQWSGKPCSSKVFSSTCDAACSQGSCPLERLQCLAVPQCKQIIACQGACLDTDKACASTCQSAQPQSAQALFTSYDGCRVAKCK